MPTVEPYRKMNTLFYQRLELYFGLLVLKDVQVAYGDVRRLLIEAAKDWLSPPTQMLPVDLQ